MAAEALWSKQELMMPIPERYPTNCHRNQTCVQICSFARHYVLKPLCIELHDEFIGWHYTSVGREVLLVSRGTYWLGYQMGGSMGPKVATCHLLLHLDSAVAADVHSAVQPFPGENSEVTQPVLNLVTASLPTIFTLAPLRLYFGAKRYSTQSGRTRGKGKQRAIPRPPPPSDVSRPKLAPIPHHVRRTANWNWHATYTEHRHTRSSPSSRHFALLMTAVDWHIKRGLVPPPALFT